MLRATVRGMQEQGPPSVTASWTEISGSGLPLLSSMLSSVDVSLFALIRTFVANVALPSFVFRDNGKDSSKYIVLDLHESILDYGAHDVRDVEDTRTGMRKVPKIKALSTRHISEVAMLTRIW